jgi:hypothetical protein
MKKVIKAIHKSVIQCMISFLLQLSKNHTPTDYSKVNLEIYMILVLIPYVLSIPLYATKLDPVYHLFIKTCPSLLGNSYLFSILRFFIIFDGLLETSRMLMLFIWSVIILYKHCLLPWFIWILILQS